MTTVAELERTIETDPVGDVLLMVAIPVSSELRAAALSRSHTRLRHRRRRRILTRGAAAAAAACLVAFTPPGHALARLVLPEGLQQRLGLLEGAPHTLTPPGATRTGAVPSGDLVSPMPCSAAPTPGSIHGGARYECYPDLTIATAQARVDFHISTPASIPPGLHYRGAITSGPHDVQMFWVRSGTQPGALGLEIKDGSAPRGGSAVPSGGVQRVTVDGSLAYVVRGDYEDSGPGTPAHWNPNADDFEMTWTHGGLTYDMTSGQLQQSVSDLVRIAESVK